LMGISALLVYLSADLFKKKTKLMLSSSMKSWVWLHEIPELALGFFLVVDTAGMLVLMKRWYPAFIGLLVFGCSLMLYYGLLASKLPRGKAIWWTAMIVCAPIALSPLFVTPLGLSLITYMPVVISFLVCAWAFERAKLGRFLTWGMAGLGLGHELFEAFILHYLGWAVFLGVDPPLRMEDVFIVFVVLQVLGAVLIWIEARK